VRHNFATLGILPLKFIGVSVFEDVDSIEYYSGLIVRNQLLLVALDYLIDRGSEILRIREKSFATKAKATVREGGSKQYYRDRDRTGRKQPIDPSRREQRRQLAFADFGSQSLHAESFVSLQF
jgi:hypothetical protein